MLLCLPLVPGCSESGNNEITKKKEVKQEVLENVRAEDFYQNGYTTNYVVGLDKFGRAFEATLGEKSDKERNVGLFYFLCSGQHDSDTIRNVTEILEQEDGMDILFYTDNETCPKDKSLYWGEPLFGYYNSLDAWVIRRHLSLLYNAGVDFLVFDTTNAVTYDSVVNKIIREAEAMIEEGWDVPKLCYYTNANSKSVMEALYRTFYKKGKYDDVWYKIDGKPLIIGTKEAVSQLSEEMQDYFYFRYSQWPNESFIEDGFPWIEWSYPAPVHNDVINVAVASHPALPMSFSVTRGAKNWGRGWNVVTKENESDKAEEGQFFQSTWDVALEADVGTVFVTGWNEWTAGKYLYDGEYAMVDLCNFEFSRDAEMMKGGAEDSFYLQLARNIRAYKNNCLSSGSCLKTENITVPMTSDLSCWDNVKAIFRETIQSNKERNCKGSAPTVSYYQAAARNFVQEMRICCDEDNVYFYIKSDSDITVREAGDETYMNIFIGTGAVELKGWQGYEFVIGRHDNGDGTVSVEALSSDFSGTAVGSAEYRIDGSVMQIKVSKDLLSGLESTGTFYFKLADGIENPSDITDYYVSGKSFPLGRLSYRYLG